MKKPEYTAGPRDRISHVRSVLEEHRINQLPVIAKGALVGIITDRDLRDAFPSVFDVPGFTEETPRKPARDPEKIRVEEVMTGNVITLGPDDGLADAAGLMRRERLGALPIVEGGVLVGILTRSDVLDAFILLAGRLDAPAATGEG
jgi:acetoin utilization protein AcuB